MDFRSNKHIITGQEGESRAVSYLLAQGYHILHKNYRYGRAEIDIIARTGDLLIFAEVKTRATDTFGFPEEAVNRKKERLILKAAEQYIQTTNWQHDIRFDIIAITLTQPPTVHHIKDAFY